MTSRKRKQGDPRRAVAYLRVSTDDQEDGLKTQRSQIEGYATAKGIDVAEWYQDEGISGAASLDRRPGLIAALAAIPAIGAGVLLAARRDRLARDPAIMLSLESDARRLGASLVTVDGLSDGEDAGSELLRHMVDGVARFERRLIAARVKAGMERLRQAGLSTGTAPIGYRKAADKAIVPGDESAAVARVLELAAEGVPHRQIADRLTAEGYRPRGVRWHPTTVIRILRRARAYGGPPPCPTPPEGATDGGGGLSQSA